MKKTASIIATIVILGGLLACLLWAMLPSGRLTPIRVMTRISEDGSLEIGSAEIEVNLPMNQTSYVHFAIPVNRNSDTASNILFSAPFNGEARFLRGKGLTDRLLEYASKNGFTVFTLEIVTKANVPQDGDYYILPEGGWYEVVFAAKKWLEERYRLESRGLLLLGESSGGSMAELMTATHPSEIRAAAWCGGSTYSPIPKGCSTQILALSTWGDATVEPTSRFVDDALQKGIPALFGETPPMWRKLEPESHHESGVEARELLRLFLKASASSSHATDDPEFQKLWQSFPHELNHAVHQNTTGKLLPYPASPQADRLLLFLFHPDRRLHLQDALYAFTLRGYKSFAVIDDASQNHETLRQALIQLRERPENKDLPLTLVANESSAPIALEVACNDLSEKDTLLIFNPDWWPLLKQQDFAWESLLSKLRANLQIFTVNDDYEGIKELKPFTIPLLQEDEYLRQWFRFLAHPDGAHKGGFLASPLASEDQFHESVRCDAEVTPLLASCLPAEASMTQALPIASSWVASSVFDFHLDRFKLMHYIRFQI